MSSGRDREQSGFAVCDEGVVWGDSGESQSGDEVSSGILEDHTVILCTKLVAREAPLPSLQRRGY